ncbi:hypothetical protein AB0D32_30205 [Micromonospora sp. NPDC048170]|uniref:hypothetical protein n=1 Tax=Micromonospora sp. NPDC048170 TaxID=3154819 RepID=UPI0033EA0FE1
MGAADPGSAREEAERLVATALAAARLAAAGAKSGQWGPLGGIVSSVLGHSDGPAGTTGPSTHGFATGTAECCVCPLCRGIAALRDPSPEFAERLATGAGDLAAGVASLLRAFTPPEPATDTPDGPATTPSPGGEDDHVWREATRSGHDSQPAPERDVWSAATRAEDEAVPAAAPPVDVAGPADAVTVRTSTDGPVVPASRVPADAGEQPPGDGA